MKSTEASTVFSHASLRHDVAFEALPKCLVGPNLSAEAFPWAQLDSLGENKGMNLHRIDFPADYCDGAGCAEILRAFGMTHPQGMRDAIRQVAGTGNKSLRPDGPVSNAVANDYKEIGKSL